MTLFEFFREFVNRDDVVLVSVCFDYPHKFRYVDMEVALPGTGVEVGPDVNRLEEKKVPGSVKVNGVWPWSKGGKPILLITLDAEKKEIEEICRHIDAKKMAGTYHDEEG